MWRLAEIGKTIIYIRKQRGYTQEKLALECDISVSYLRMIEHGRANFTCKELVKIADALDVEPSDLLTIQAGRRAMK